MPKPQEQLLRPLHATAGVSAASPEMQPIGLVILSAHGESLSRVISRKTGQWACAIPQPVILHRHTSDGNFSKVQPGRGEGADRHEDAMIVGGVAHEGTEC